MLSILPFDNFYFIVRLVQPDLQRILGTTQDELKTNLGQNNGNNY